MLGLTRGAVPVLANSGVKMLTVGCNGAGAPPAVPRNQPFLWRDERTGTELVAMWHAGLPQLSRKLAMVHCTSHAAAWPCSVLGLQAGTTADNSLSRQLVGNQGS